MSSNPLLELGQTLEKINMYLDKDNLVTDTLKVRDFSTKDGVPELAVVGIVDGTKAMILRQAMGSGETVSFDYDGKPRVVEVHAIGLSTKDDSIVFRGYQVGGEASTPLPRWGLFTLSKVPIGTLTRGEPASQAPREGYAEKDKQMRVIMSELVRG